MKLLRRLFLFLFLLSGGLIFNSFSAGLQQDTLKIPGVQKIRGGGRGDGTGGGRGDGTGRKRTMPEDFADSSNNESVSLEDATPTKNQIDSTQVLTLLALAESYEQINLDSAIYYAKRALLLGEQVNYKVGMIKSRQWLNSFYYSGAFADKGVENGLALLELTSDQPNFYRARTYASLATYYQISEQFQEAKTFYQLALDGFAERNDTINIIVNYIDLGLLFNQLELFDSAIYYLEEGVSISELAENHVAVHYILGRIGNVYSEIGDFEKAVNYLDRSLRLKKQYYRPVSLAYGFYNLQQAYLKEGLYEESIQYGEELQRTLNINPGTFLFKRSIEATQLAHERLGSPMPTYVEESNHPLMDALNAQEYLMQLRQLRAFHNNEKTDEYIYSQRSEIGQLEAKTAFQKELIIWIVGGLLLGFGGVYLTRSRMYAIREKKIQEDFSQQLLGYQEEERMRISRDLHDSIGQSLVMIKNKVQLDQDASTTEMVANTLEEVRTISKQLHPVLLEKMGLTAAIEKLVEEVDTSSEIFLECEIDNIDNTFEKDSELHIYRILQETINNMIKHSETKSATIKIENSTRSISCSVIDHGKGFDLTENPERLQSLGMLTLKERTKILNGKLGIDSTKGKGTSVVLTIEKPKEE